MNIDVADGDLDRWRRMKELEQSHRIVKDDAQHPLTEQGPAGARQLIRMAADDHILIFTAHHIVCDGWSTNVLADELAKLYSAKVEGAAAKLSPAVRFSEYAREQSKLRQSGENSKIEAYWLDQLKSFLLSHLNCLRIDRELRRGHRLARRSDPR